MNDGKLLFFWVHLLQKISRSLARRLGGHDTECLTQAMSVKTVQFMHGWQVCCFEQISSTSESSEPDFDSWEIVESERTYGNVQ